MPDQAPFDEIAKAKNKHDAADDDRYAFPKRAQGFWHQVGAFLFFFFPLQVARTHYQNAVERFITLWRYVDYYSMVYSSEDCATSEGSRGFNRRSARRRLPECYKILDNAYRHLSRDESNLNCTWRELTRVHQILVEYVFEPQKLAQQIDLCREDANRLGLTGDAYVASQLEQAAEALDATSLESDRSAAFGTNAGAAHPKRDNPEGGTVVDNPKVRRILRALLDRFNTHRTSRMRQQHLNAKTYCSAWIILFAMGLLLIFFFDEVIFPSTVPSMADNLAFPKAETIQTIFGMKKEVFPLNAQALTHGPMGFFIDFGNSIKLFFDVNILCFVYFAGLVGGYFSVATRVRTQKLNPGEDAYISWYILMQPFIGALGAVVFYILADAGFVERQFLDLGTVANAKVFAVSFLAGFSERLVFPELRNASRKEPE